MRRSRGEDGSLHPYEADDGIDKAADHFTLTCGAVEGGRGERGEQAHIVAPAEREKKEER